MPHVAEESAAPAITYRPSYAWYPTNVAVPSRITAGAATSISATRGSRFCLVSRTTNTAAAIAEREADGAVPRLQVRGDRGVAGRSELGRLLVADERPPVPVHVVVKEVLERQSEQGEGREAGCEQVGPSLTVGERERGDASRNDGVHPDVATLGARNLIVSTL